MQIYQNLLGLKFKLIEGAEAWHEEVRCYEVRDKESSEVVGHFYLDLFPRPNKFNHAAAFNLLPRARVDGQVLTGAVALVTNFSPAGKGEEALLMHREVVTFFHEFGHVMHHMCSEANYARFSGTAVERDFVEMPSQMLENWIWDKDILKLVSKHYKTGESLPDDLIDKKIRSKNENAALNTLNQLFKSIFDFLIYSASD
jgi:thimet oligopeptidase